ncbi:MAG: hypothetical protein Q8922_09940, partial [Bacteroidota bacterium]|nr:hypothetical protein [Bacteroidota bacterium]
MKSRRSWLMGLALGVALSFGAPSLYAQGSGPRLISYQGLMVNPTTQQKMTGTHTVTVNYWNAASGGGSLGSE